MSGNANLVPLTPRFPRKIQLEDWIREALTDTDKEKPCSQLTLVHMAGMTRQEVHTCRLGAGKDWNEKTLSNLFMGKAKGYAQELPGVQTFNLLAFYGTDHPEASHPFVITGETEFHGLMTEDPSPRGQTQQMMRLTEVGFQGGIRLLLQAQENLLRANEGFMRANAQLQDNLERARTSEYDALDIAKKLILEREDRQHAHRLEMLKESQRLKDRETVMKFLPVGINAVAGREVIPQSAVDSQLIEFLCERVNTEDELRQFKMMFNVPDELWTVLLMRWTDHMKKKRLDEERFKQLSDEVAARLDGQADAGGESMVKKGGDDD